MHGSYSLGRMGLRHGIRVAACRIGEFDRVRATHLLGSAAENDVAVKNERFGQPRNSPPPRPQAKTKVDLLIWHRDFPSYPRAPYPTHSHAVHTRTIFTQGPSRPALFAAPPHRTPSRAETPSSVRAARKSWQKRARVYLAKAVCERTATLPLNRNLRFCRAAPPRQPRNARTASTLGRLPATTVPRRAHSAGVLPPQAGTPPPSPPRAPGCALGPPPRASGSPTGATPPRHPGARPCGGKRRPASP